MISLPFWLQQRGGELAPIDERTIQIKGTQLPTCELSVFPMPTGVGWRVAIDLITGECRKTLAHTESPFENEMAAWQAGFDLYRQRIDKK
ncbi:MAG: hypothetical protein JNJ77_21985 [Planctomycetia bacterium]|nr:hypothetical protein [Planctomycetia bacterium]